MPIQLDNLDTISKFSKDIDNLISSKKISLIEAITIWCEQHDTEIEYAASLIKKNKILKNKLREEAESLNFIKKTGRLPL